MASNEDILKAVKGIETAQVNATTQITGRMDSLDGRMDTLDGRLVAQGEDIAAVRESQVKQGEDITAVRGSNDKHKAWHAGLETAEAKAVQAGAKSMDDDREREKRFTSRLKLALAIGALLVSAVVYVVTGVVSSDGKPPSDVQALTVTVNKLNQALDKMLDRPEPAPRDLAGTTASTATGDDSTRGGT